MARRTRREPPELAVAPRPERQVAFALGLSAESRAAALLIAKGYRIVIRRQQRRIIAAAEAWLASHPDDINCDIRFDVMLVAPKSLPRHIVAAFDASN